MEKKTKLRIHWTKRFEIDNKNYLERCEAEELRRQTLEILNSPDLNLTVKLIAGVVSKTNGEAGRKEKMIYEHMIENYPGTISLKLLHVFLRFKSEPGFRVPALYLLRSHLSTLRRNFKPLSLIFTSLMKSDIVSSLSQEKLVGGQFRLLSKIVSLVANSVFESETGEWKALRNLINSEIRKSEPEKGLMIFQELPLNTNLKFLTPILPETFLAITEELKPRGQKLKPWNTAFGAAFNFVLLVHGVRGDDFPSRKRKLVRMMVNKLTRSMTQLIENGDGDFVKSGMHHLVELVTEKAVCFSIGDCEFLRDLISKITGINGVSDSTKQVAFSVLIALQENSIVDQMNNCDAKQEDATDSQD